MYIKTIHTYLVVITELPEENKELLVKVDLLGGVREVCLLQRVVEEPSEATQHKREVFLTVNATQVVDEQITGHGRLKVSEEGMRRHVRGC